MLEHTWELGSKAHKGHVQFYLSWIKQYTATNQDSLLQKIRLGRIEWSHVGSIFDKLAEPSGFQVRQAAQQQDF